MPGARGPTPGFARVGRGLHQPPQQHIPIQAVSHRLSEPRRFFIDACAERRARLSGETEQKTKADRCPKVRVAGEKAERGEDQPM